MFVRARCNLKAGTCDLQPAAFPPRNLLTHSRRSSMNPVWWSFQIMVMAFWRIFHRNQV